MVEDTVRQTVIAIQNGEEVKQTYDLKTVGDLWASKSPYRYIPEKQEDY